eukprot:GHVU01130403.1.p1 GENE.GHVU01130403.1~~GHVU01130403.1.p1  ORF type:complete len:113 (-),score=15.28 GHVU01130403.1:41-379(-)
MNKVKAMKLKKLVASFFLKEGKIHTEEEYMALGHRQPLVGSSIRSNFGGYPGLLNGIKGSSFWDDIKHLEVKTPEVKPTVKPVETIAPAKPTLAKKPVIAKPAKVKVEKKDG